jgi:hypothetical protein
MCAAVAVNRRGCWRARRRSSIARSIGPTEQWFTVGTVGRGLY